MSLENNELLEKEVHMLASAKAVLLEQIKKIGRELAVMIDICNTAVKRLDEHDQNTSVLTMERVSSEPRRASILLSLMHAQNKRAELVQSEVFAVKEINRIEALLSHLTAGVSSTSPLRAKM